MPPLIQTTTGVTSSQVMIRFVLRIAVLAMFAIFGSIGFARSLAALLWMSLLISIVTAVFRQESVRAPHLNYWDEAAAYGALFCLASIITSAQNS